MASTIRGVAIAAALAIALGAVQSPALACSVCLAGDPNFSNHGASAQQPGDFVAYLEFRAWTKESGLLPGEAEAPGPSLFDEDAAAIAERLGDADERNESERLDLYLSWTPVDRVTLTLDLPFAFNEIIEREGVAKTHSSLSGFGDLALLGSLVLWRDRDVLPSTWLEGRAMVKFPTGKSEQREDGVRDPHLQLGTGSWDFGFGLAATHRFSWASLYASAFYRENTKGSLHYRYGDVVLANAALEVPVGHAIGRPELERFTLGFELNFRYSEHDRSRGQRYRDSGGSILYATPSLRVRLPWFGGRRPPSLRLAAQIPTTSGWLNHNQHEDVLWSTGLQYGF